MYFPSMGYLRSQVIPEEQRASIMNWFRVPMNLITCGGLLWLHQGEAAGGNQVSPTRPDLTCCGFTEGSLRPPVAECRRAGFVPARITSGALCSGPIPLGGREPPCVIVDRSSSR